MSGQYLLFQVAGHRLAMPVAAVDGVLPPAPVTPVPFVPAWVDGLVLVRGAVVPQLDLVAWLDGAPHRPAAYELLHIRTPEGPAVVKVDRVLRLVAAPDPEARVIDPGALVLGDGQAAPEVAALPTLDVAEPARTQAPAIVPELTMVVSVAGELFGLPIHHVREVVEVEGVTALPLAPAALLGLFPLRGREVPLVSMAGLLGGDARPTGRAVIVGTPDGPVALAVDRIVGLERMGELEEHPLLDRWRCLTGCWLGRDGSVIGLVFLDFLLDQGWRDRLIPFFPADHATGEQRVAEPTRALLTFQLAEQLCAVDVLAVERVVEWAPSSAIPDGGKGVDGIVQVGGAILPVVDLAAQLGMAGGCAGCRALLVVRLAGDLMALAVGAIGRMVAQPVRAVHPLGGSQLVEAVARVGGDLAWVLSLSDLEHRMAA